MAARTVLLVAYHVPPVLGSSGVQRTLRFAQHLPKFGWRPIVLTITPRAYESVAAAAGNEMPPNVRVERAFGLDAARQLSLFGRYPRRLAIPDRWATWRSWAVRKARRILATEPVDAIWSTFPIATAHEIGLAIAEESRLPWVAEFRDPMWQGDYPPDPAINRAWQQLEQRVFAHADRVVVTTPSAVSLYADRFPTFARQRIVQIENGYDEETFARAAEPGSSSRRTEHAGDGPITLLHSGIVYRSERDPTQLFQAVANLKARGALSPRKLQIILRASSNEAVYRSDLAALDIDDIVRLEPGIDYLRALQEMLTVDGLLLLQAANCNAQVPAKLYEYLRAGRPILALTDPNGDTARTLGAAGAGLIARLDSTPEIEQALLAFIQQIRSGTWRQPSHESIAKYSREVQTGELAHLLDSLMSSPVPKGILG